jgi:CysZ protein
VTPAPLVRQDALLARRPAWFGTGFGAFWGGVGFVIATPAVWLPAMVPIGMAVLLLSGVGALGVWGADAAAAALAGASSFGLWTLRIVFGVVAVLVAFLVAISLAQPLSGWALDRIVRRQEASLGAPAQPELPRLKQMMTALAVNLLALAVGLPIFALLTAIGLIFPAATVVTIPLKVCVAALLVAWDFLDYPLSLRGLGVGARLRWVGRRFTAVFGFGICAAVILLVPCVGLLVLPFGVAGAARLAVESEGE